LTEAKGIPISIVIGGANRNDFKMIRQTIEAIQPSHPVPMTGIGVCMDKGYDFPEVRQIAQEFGFTAHIRSRGEEADKIKHEAGFRARRWVVERTHSWLNRFRRILVRWEKLASTYIAMLHLACGIITWRAAGLTK
jgi:putative transposase